MVSYVVNAAILFTIVNKYKEFVDLTKGRQNKLSITFAEKINSPAWCSRIRKYTKFTNSNFYQCIYKSL